MPHWPLVLLLLLAGGRAGQGAEPHPIVPGDAQAAVMFRWATQRCDALHIPDSPARALRAADGSLALFAAHLVNIPWLGADFDRLVPACAARSRGEESADPSALRDRFWVQAVLPFAAEGRRWVLGLASHEFMGARHPGQCLAPTGASERVRAAFRCWRSAITPVLAREGEWVFRPPAPGAVVIASPVPHDPATVTRSGFFSVSNPIVADGEATLLVYTEGVAGQPLGNCLLRAPLEALPEGWQVLSRGRFVARAAGAAAADQPCDVVGAGVFGAAPIRSVVLLDGWYVAVFTRAAPAGQATAVSDGVFVSSSRDLRNWTPARRLWPMTPFRGQPEAGVYYEYPSLIDHASPATVFDRVAPPGQRQLHLYLTRFNLEDRRQGMNRDLVRLPVRVEP